MNIIKQKINGFTLVETIVAVMLFAILFAALIMIISRMVTLMNVSKDRAKANEYLQDAMEHLRIQRDSFDTWSDFITDGGGSSCVFKPEVTAPPNPVDINVNDAQFTQNIIISSSDCSKKALFTVTIFWGKDETVEGQTYLSSW